jgi:hypothetical protein
MGKPHLLGKIQSKTPKISTPSGAKKDSGDDNGSRHVQHQHQHPDSEMIVVSSGTAAAAVVYDAVTASAASAGKRKRGGSDLDPIEEQLYSIHPTGARGRRLEQVEDELAQTQSRVRQLEEMIRSLIDRMPAIGLPAIGYGGSSASSAAVPSGAAAPVTLGALVPSEVQYVTDTLFQSVPDSDDALFSGGSFDGFLAMENFGAGAGDVKYVSGEMYQVNSFMERGGSAIAQRRLGKQQQHKQQQQQQQHGKRVDNRALAGGSSSSSSSFSLFWFLITIVLLLVVGSLLVSKAQKSGVQWDKLVCGKLKQGSSIQKQCIDIFTSQFFKAS